MGWGFTSAEKQVASLKDRGIVLFSSTIFLFGVAIQFISRAVHNPKQHDSQQQAGDKYQHFCVKNAAHLGGTVPGAPPIDQEKRITFLSAVRDPVLVVPSPEME